MINSRFRPFLFAVMLFISVMPFSVTAQDKDTGGRDFAELLEMELSDVKQENARLTAELKKLKEEVPENSGSNKEIKKLKKENSLLKDEIIELDASLKFITKTNKSTHEEVSLLRKELKQAKSRSKKDSGAVQDSSDSNELNARCKNLEDENAILKSEVDERKSIEEQRKEAFDNLFKELADIKRNLKEKDGEISELKSEAEAVAEAMRAKDAEVSAVNGSMKKMKSLADAHSEKVRALNETIQKERAKLAEKESDLKKEMASRQAVEAELSRIKLTDGQRKKTMDDVLTSLATAENLNKENSARIRELESELSEITASNASESARLKTNLKVAEDEVARLEQELKSAVDSRNALNSKINENNSVAQRDTARIVELEADLARIRATDNQRKKSMDKLLLEIASLEETQGNEQGEVRASRKELKKSKDELAHVREELDSARKQIAALKKSKRGSKGASPDVSGELSELKRQNDELRSTVSDLEKRLSSAAADNSKSNDNSEDEKALVAMEKEQWVKAKADLEKEISHLQKTAGEKEKMISSLKGDLAEAEQAKGVLAKEAEQLRNRKVDVRGSDLFQEMEQINVTLREKIVQIETERQRLAKAVKKMEKRDDRYDDEIGHEKNMRQKTESELADARAREIEYQELIERLMAQVPELEKQISELSEKSSSTSSLLSQREEDLRAMKAELEKREHRLIKAERVAEVLENARNEVLHESDREKLDMHYNMAAVYAREGKFKEAEQQYLHALRLNPTDADVHYNLGILYDDELKSPEKAVVHYRRYLKLSPHGPDADQVRNWLMRLEMKKKR